MREKIKDPGRIRHMLDAARILVEETPAHSLESIQKDRIPFFVFARRIELNGEESYKLTK